MGAEKDGTQSVSKKYNAEREKTQVSVNIEQQMVLADTPVQKSAVPLLTKLARSKE